MIDSHLRMIQHKLSFLADLAEQPGLFARYERIALSSQLQREQAQVEDFASHRHIGSAGMILPGILFDPVAQIHDGVREFERLDQPVRPFGLKDRRNLTAHSHYGRPAFKRGHDRRNPAPDRQCIVVEKSDQRCFGGQDSGVSRC
ncbi:hypothetical protein D3C71_1429790 [compost metagenome]